MIQRAPEPETWRTLPKYEGYYEVSDLGRIRSVDRIVTFTDGRTRRYVGKVLTPSYRGHSRGYAYVFLKRGPDIKTMYVHRAVLLAFVGEPPTPDTQASHEPDPDPSNCRLSNLRWRTPDANRAERDLRLSGMSWEEIQALINRIDGPGCDEEPSSADVADYDPVLTGETPF